MTKAFHNISFRIAKLLKGGRIHKNGKIRWKQFGEFPRTKVTLIRTARHCDTVRSNIQIYRYCRTIKVSCTALLRISKKIRNL